MKFSDYILAALPIGASLANAATLSSTQHKRAATNSSCTNGPKSRSCWSPGFDINTDFDLSWPNTGNTVTYNLEITNGTCNPDGHGARLCLLFNGQYPGPTIRANWGDQLVINVKNSMQDNGTSIHWHGVRQLNTVGSDGVNGLTECPLAPGQSRIYSFQATQYGTSWYHAHYSAQYGDGVVGTIIFDGPASANYDVDLGAYPLNEWYYQTAFQTNLAFGNNLNTGVGPFQAGPAANNMLVNGTNKDALGLHGKYSQVTVVAGKRYRLRLVNIGVDNYMHVSLDGHKFSVIAADFVPIKPFTASYLTMGAGQRYDVIITANQTAGNYWFRADVATECGSNNNGNGRAIWTYSTVAVATPFTFSFIAPQSCQEPGPLVPYWEEAIPSGGFQSQLETEDLGLTKAIVVPGQGSIVVWALNVSINVDYMMPTLSYIMEGNTSYPEAYNLVPTASEGDWNYWLIQQTSGAPPISHPMHLHGHDFYVLGQGTGTYSSSSALNFQNPTRRDTVSIYSGGWLAVAFKSNNPGTWLMHCHIAWHISEGLGMQYLEAPSQIVLPDQATYNSQCAAWDSYYKTAYYKKIDSGL